VLVGGREAGRTEPRQDRLVRCPRMELGRKQDFERGGCGLGGDGAGCRGEEFFDAEEVGFGVDSDGVVLGFGDVEGKAVFEQAELFEAFGELEGCGREAGEALEGGAAVGVEAEVLEIRHCAGVVAVEGDGGAREVEGPAVGGGDDFDGVGVGDVFGTAEDFERGDVDGGVGERREDVRDVVGMQERLVALDVDVDVCGELLADGVEAVGAAGEFGCGEDGGDVVGGAEVHDLGTVGGDDDVVELGAALGSFVDP